MEFNESTFIRDYKSNPNKAFTQLMDGFRDRIYLFCHRVAPSAVDAQDLTQDVFIRIWKGLARFRGDSKLTTWIYRIAWNVCASHLEKKGRAPELTPYMEYDGEDEEPRLIIPSEDRKFDQFEKRQFIEELFNSLPASQKLVTTLYYFQEQTYDEIATVTGWPMGTVKATLYRAKNQLRRAALLEMGAERVSAGD